ncbi:hypothetical protein K8Z61_05830 [Nocardioides sp. TRM66260-LWL]|uniref:hypothetical protein n=1 Tax=Nocardioides sp. TRM66260-LWL TaxID=2874478 RepID=UPI001CC3CB63|nr:hypothetical protein [Nocardioides sp. TRM66260-LWL]MBZ5734010.1 hypothetical protein [Nocardioides sp. TRM66260-LWL]
MDVLDLPETDDGGTAADVYLVGIEPRRRGRARTIVYAVLDLWCAMSGGTMELSRGIDVVVRRRDEGLLVLTLPERDPSAAAFTLERLQEQLAGSTPAEFRAAWGLD